MFCFVLAKAPKMHREQQKRLLQGHDFTGKDVGFGGCGYHRVLSLPNGGEPKISWITIGGPLD